MPASRDRLATLFRQIRRDAGISHGGEAARRAGVTQATVSRWERGQSVPTAEQAYNYAHALGADDATIGQLIQLVSDLRINYRAGKPGPPAGIAVHQRAQRLDAGAHKIVVFQPILVPGALQTTDYARAVFSSGDLTPAEIEETVASRRKRGELLANTDRQYTFLLTEGVLGWCAGSPAIMVGQLEHLSHLATQENITIGLIPWGTPVDVYPPGGFDLYDDRTAVVGFPNGMQFFNEPADVTPYLTMVKRLEALAFTGEAAEELLLQAAHRYAELSLD